MDRFMQVLLASLPNMLHGFGSGNKSFDEAKMRDLMKELQKELSQKQDENNYKIIEKVLELLKDSMERKQSEHLAKENEAYKAELDKLSHKVEELMKDREKEIEKKGKESTSNFSFDETERILQILQGLKTGGMNKSYKKKKNEGVFGKFNKQNKESEGRCRQRSQRYTGMDTSKMYHYDKCKTEYHRPYGNTGEYRSEDQRSYGYSGEYMSEDQRPYGFSGECRSEDQRSYGHLGYYTSEDQRPYCHPGEHSLKNQSSYRCPEGRRSGNQRPCSYPEEHKSGDPKEYRSRDQRPYGNPGGRRPEERNLYRSDESLGDFSSPFGNKDYHHYHQNADFAFHHDTSQFRSRPFGKCDDREQCSGFYNPGGQSHGPQLRRAANIKHNMGSLDNTQYSVENQDGGFTRKNQYPSPFSANHGQRSKYNNNSTGPHKGESQNSMPGRINFSQNGRGHGMGKGRGRGMVRGQGHGMGRGRFQAQGQLHSKSNPNEEQVKKDIKESDQKDSSKSNQDSEKMNAYELLVKCLEEIEVKKLEDMEKSQKSQQTTVKTAFKAKSRQQVKQKSEANLSTKCNGKDKNNNTCSADDNEAEKGPRKQNSVKGVKGKSNMNNAAEEISSSRTFEFDFRVKLGRLD